MEKNLDLIVDYTRKFIEAVTPVAKQAYEIGLLTLRIDGAQSVIISAALLIIGVLAIRRVRSDWEKAKIKAALPRYENSAWMGDPCSHLPMDGILHIIGFGLAIGAVVAGAVRMLSVWMWVKLFSPELWLAHQAVEKIMK